MKNGYLILPVLAGVMWGSAGIFVRTLSGYGMEPATMLFTRVTVAVIIMAAWLFVYDRKLLKIKIRDIGWMAACGLTGMLGLNMCYMRAIEDLSLSLAAVLLGLSPVFVMFFAAVIFKERLTKQKVFCTVLALCGCLLVSGMLEADGLQWTWKGIALGLGSAIFYAVYSIVSKKTMQKGYSVFTIIFYSVLLMMLVLIPFVDWKITVQYATEDITGHALFMIGHALCTSILPYILFTFALKHADTGKVSLLASGGEPTAAAIFGLLIFGEIPSLLSALGLVITIIALALITRAEEQ